jgi:DNA-binding LytR/AlgR family response regulator
MLNILLFEDDRGELLRCNALIGRVLPDIHVFPAQNRSDVLQIVRQRKIDAAFIDIGLPDIGGFGLVDQITTHEHYLLLPMIFVAGTNGDSLEMREKYHHYAYITKPYTNSRFIEIATPFLKGIANNKKDILDEAKDKGLAILIASARTAYSIKISDILYAEVQGHALSLCTKKQIFSDIRMDLTTFVEQVNDSDFVRCHKSYAVNISNIYSIVHSSQKTWEIYFDAACDKKCPLSISYRSAVHSIATVYSTLSGRN